MNQLNGTQKLPNANLVLILGILSIITCCCYGVIGLILGIVALVLAKKDKAMYLENPQAYSNYSNLNIGRILAIIGIVLSILYFVLHDLVNLRCWNGGTSRSGINARKSS